MILLTSGQGRGPMPREVPYATSKAALSGIVLTLADCAGAARDHRQRRQPGADGYGLGAG